MGTTVEAMQYGAACRFCQGTDTIVDHVSGDHVCTSCGTVLEERCIDSGVEWRSFKEEGVHMGARVEGRQRAELLGDGEDFFLEETNMEGTGFAGSDPLARKLQSLQWQAQTGSRSTGSAEDRFMKNAMGKTRDLAKQLNLSDSIAGRCNSLLKCHYELSKQHGTKQQQLSEPMMLAICYLACREEHVGRTVKELVHTYAPDRKNLQTLEKSVERKVIQLKKDLAGELSASHTSFVPPRELMGRFTSRLGLSHEVCNAATFMAEQMYKIREVMCVKSTTAAYAAVAVAILVVAWLLDTAVKPSFSEVAVIAKVTEADVQRVYNKVLPHIGRCLPSAFKCRLSGGVGALPKAKGQTAA